MNLVPLHSTPIPGVQKNHDDVMLVNFKYVFNVEKLLYWSELGESVEGSRIHLAAPNGDSHLTYDVRETRVAILRMLGVPEEDMSL